MDLLVGRQGLKPWTLGLKVRRNRLRAMTIARRTRKTCPIGADRAAIPRNLLAPGLQPRRYETFAPWYTFPASPLHSLHAVCGALDGSVDLTSWADSRLFCGSRRRLAAVTTPTNNPVVLEPYDARWALNFEALKQVYVSALGDLAQAVEQVGSTSVPGLLAKPILDVDIVIASEQELPAVTERLERLGYRHNGDQGVPGREAFPRDNVEEVPRDGSGRRWPSHHLYVCTADSVELWRHLSFRDRLRSNTTAAREYGLLKQKLAALHPYDRDRYCDAKTDFIEATIREATLSRNAAQPGIAADEHLGRSAPSDVRR